MQLEAYLTLSGRCEEALEFYKSVIGGSYELQRFSNMPASGDLPEHWKNKVMHSTFSFDGGRFMASDSSPDAVPAADSNVSLSLAVKDADEARRIFSALSEGGKIETPFEKTFWSAGFGEVRDKFGIYWLVSAFE